MNKVDKVKEEFIEYLSFLLSNKLNMAYSIRDLRKEVLDKIRDLENEE